jgi:hypothetical protein
MMNAKTVESMNRVGIPSVWGLKCPHCGKPSLLVRPICIFCKKVIHAPR